MIQGMAGNEGWRERWNELLNGMEMMRKMSQDQEPTDDVKKRIFEKKDEKKTEQDHQGKNAKIESHWKRQLSQRITTLRRF